MPKYRKKPVVVIAEQFTDNKPCQGVYGGYIHQRRCIACLPEKNYEIYGPSVITIHGQVTKVADGDWIIDEGDGLHFYPCKPHIFEATYEPVGEPPPIQQLPHGYDEVRQALMKNAVDEIEVLRKILAHVPARVAIAAKEAAGYPNYVAPG